ncbi:MAG: hypothetical protein FJ086_08680 [Deltaproteobacteria bacterium]|nr:hypothetical protein [Deltaproteobacteria bacterium]
MSPLRTALLLAALGMTGCRGPVLAVQPVAPGEVLLETLEVRFDEPGRGQLKLGLAANGVGEPVQAQSVDWELWLDNRYFAAGVEQVDVALPASGEVPVTLELPLHFPKLPASAEPQRMQLSARGGLVLRGGAREERHPFQGSVKATVARAPQLGGPGAESP